MRTTYSSGLYFILGLLNFVAIAIIGITIRWHLIHPIDGFNYINWLHAHSHVAFLGWVFFGLISLINLNFENDPRFPNRPFIRLAWPLVISNIGMLISFPIQGYGPVSIFFSSLHMAFGIVVFIQYARYFIEKNSLGIKLIKWGFFWMIISGLGPLALGPIILTGNRDTYWYDFAIYFYLHFQYNGFFILVILGLIINQLLKKRILYLTRFKNAIIIGMNAAVLLTFFLSTLSIDPPIIFNLLGGIGAAIQIVIIIFILLSILRQFGIFLSESGIFINVFLILSLAALELKLYLQFFSGIPAFAEWIFGSRNIIIAYLHLVLIGLVSTFIIGWWYKLKQYKESKLFKFGAIYYLAGFTGIEIVLLLMTIRVFDTIELAYQILLIASFSLATGILLITWDVIRDPQVTGSERKP